MAESTTHRARLPWLLAFLCAGCSVIALPDEDLLGDGGAAQGGSPVGGGGAAGGGAAEGGAGDGGAGGGGEPCTTAAECPDPGGPCAAPACVAGVCSVAYSPAGTVLARQTPFDCVRLQCGDAGLVVVAIDDLDVPVDGNSCTADACTLGAPSNPLLPAGTPCGSGLSCDGAGACSGCTAAAQCPGVDDECKTRTCTAGVCGVAFTPAGTPLTTQILGNCLEDRCDGVGSAIAAVEDLDVPFDGLDCTTDACSMGVASNDPAPWGDPCDDAGGAVCDSNGACVACNVAPDCGASTDCRTFACDAAGACSFSDAPSGAACDDGGGTFCDGAGACVAPVMVLSTSPSDGAAGVSPHPLSVVIGFSGPVTPSSLTLDTSLDDGPCAGAIQLSSDDFATCVPFGASTPAMSAGDTVATMDLSPRVAFGLTYRLRVTAAALDAIGQPVVPFTSPLGFTVRTDSRASVVISQVYGGGGAAGATYSHDFVELHNRTTAAVDLSGWSLQYAAAGAAGSWADVISLPPIALPPGGYFLVRGASTGAGGAPLPAPDLVGAVDLDGSSGKVALVASTSPLTSACPLGGGVVDLVGYGATNQTCVEGTGTLPDLPTAAHSAQRRSQGCFDTDGTALDLQNATPGARTSASPALVCAGPAANETNVAGELDYCALQFPQTLTVQSGASTGLVFGRVYEAGVTEAAGPSPAVVAQLGYGPTTSNPELQMGWTWLDASFNVQAGNDDEYGLAFTAPAAGTYAYAYRFSIDGGLTWTFCDTDGAGSNPGLEFETVEVGILTVTP